MFYMMVMPIAIGVAAGYLGNRWFSAEGPVVWKKLAGILGSGLLGIVLAAIFYKMTLFVAGDGGSMNPIARAIYYVIYLPLAAFSGATTHAIALWLKIRDA